MKFWAYMWLQAAVTLVYFGFRFYVVEDSDKPTLSQYEFNSMMVLGVVMVLRMIRVDSWLGYVVFGLKVMHITMLGLIFMFNKTFALGFAIVVVVVHFGVDPPFFEVSQRVATLPEVLLEPYIERVEECFILFYATWEERSIGVTPVFGKIADKYTTEKRLFARFDIGRSDRAQERFKISATNGTLRQLPTIIHFKNGKEVKRLNPNTQPGAILNMPTIVKYFQLNQAAKPRK